MDFGPVPVSDSEGTFLAHSLKLGAKRFKKGHLITPDDIEILREAGIETVLAARLSASDVDEQEAAQRIAAAIVGDNIRLDPPFTGRVNLFAETDGVLVVDEEAISRLNRLHPSITFATLANYECVEIGRMVATVKIIPFAAPLECVEMAETMGSIIRLAAFAEKKVALVATELASLKSSVMDKTHGVLQERLKRAKASLITETRVGHDTTEIADGLKQVTREHPDLIVLFGASATVDEGDVGPAGLVAAGGTLHHFGMPVDPGNLLFVGDLEGIPVIGAPGCARSPAENGFDWVLNRTLAGIDVTPDDLMGLGVGGLLMEITSRPQPRAGSGEKAEKIAAIILAAGQSRRMGGPNKLLATIDGVPLVRCVAEALRGAEVGDILVVTGHRADEIEAALDGLPVRFTRNPDYAEGLSTSLRTGIAALDETTDAALIALGDMPFLEAQAFNQVIERYRSDEDIHAVVSTSKGKRGNPVLWSKRFFSELKAIHGDTGARHLIGEHEAVIAEVEIGEAAAIDLDTPEALAAAGGEIAEQDKR